MNILISRKKRPGDKHARNRDFQIRKHAILSFVMHSHMHINKEKLTILSSKIQR